ncbi:5'-3' exonuclease H3TH domain-containing protein [Paenibacillus sp. FSL H7-0331]|uniref:5'-3' exonuclease n=1 Tax=Paenibacillus sp. FSL H7-0331 TaxID=1920421 RepID=UPI0021167207|nr:5'-3' exonuclease H3TH domain-containing protein [Paenibacillus sp. FSL H7-0331]
METNSDLSTEPKVLIVDGMALLFRAFYATSYSGYIRKTSAGLPTNAVYGFIQYLFDAVKTFKPTHVVCCWDLGGTTIRAELFDSYKANRKAPPEELIPQFELVKEVVAEMGILNLGVQGYEADDCIGTVAKTISEEAHVYILTGDHDMLQLISERIHVIIMKKGKLNYLTYDLQVLWEEKQLHPYQIIELKSFMGDTSDNYPGVRGIGEKTALKLVQEYQTVEGVLDALESLPKGVRTKIESDRDMLMLSKDLATIRLDVPLTCSLEQCIWSIQKEATIRKFDELEFGGLIKIVI